MGGREIGREGHFKEGTLRRTLASLQYTAHKTTHNATIATLLVQIQNCGIRHVTVPIATRILIANVRHIGLSNIWRCCSLRGFRSYIITVLDYALALLWRSLVTIAMQRRAVDPSIVNGYINSVL